MKRTLYIILIITTLLTLLFTSCNADASAGLFRQLADAKEPVGIRYKQIIGRNIAKNTLYFLTNDGIYKTDGTTTTRIRENERGYPVHAAYFSDPNDLIFYLINNGNNAEIHRLTLNDNGEKKMVLTSSLTGIKAKHLLTNGSVLVQGVKDGKNAFALIEYNSVAESFDIAGSIFEDLDGYGLDSILFMSGKEQDSSDFMISFVNGDKNYKHYYKTQANEVTFGSSLAAFSIENSKLYLLTKNGALFGSAVPVGVAVAPTSMENTGKSYQSNAFMYAVTDDGENKTYLITKSNVDNEAMYIFSLAKGATDTATSHEVKAGYASQMSNINIVSAFEKDSGKLLIATEKNGMFDISITNASTGAGSSKGPETYTIN